MREIDFKVAALGKSYGYDGGSPGSAGSPSIWLFGLEPGSPVAPQPDEDQVAEYSVATQLRWPYNVAAFKLLTAIAGEELEKFEIFAHERRIFERDSPGYFKGNLFPYPCYSLETWSEDARRVTGFSSKNEYKKWCREHRYAVIRDWLAECKPRIFIGVGISHRKDFASVVLGPGKELVRTVLHIDEKDCPVYYGCQQDRFVFVVPHFTNRFRRPSDNVLRAVGSFISKSSK